MISEKFMEDAISTEPEKYLDETGLKLIARQYRIGSHIFDLLFEDRHGAKLIVEIQKGTLDRKHTYKILDYYAEYKGKHPEEFIELMVIATKIPYERRTKLDSYGISWKEIPEKIFNATLEDIPIQEKIEIKPPAILIKKARHQPLRVGPGYDCFGQRTSNWCFNINKTMGKFIEQGGQHVRNAFDPDIIARITGDTIAKVKEHINWLLNHRSCLEIIKSANPSF